MPKKIHIKVNYGRTVNIGNYENVRLEEEVLFLLEDGDNLESVRRQAYQEVVQSVNQKAKVIKEKSN